MCQNFFTAGGILYELKFCDEWKWRNFKDSFGAIDLLISENIILLVCRSLNVGYYEKKIYLKNYKLIKKKLHDLTVVFRLIDWLLVGSDQFG